MNINSKLVKARTTLVLEKPFFGALALRLAVEQTDVVGTMAVDGKTLFYNAEFVENLSMPELKGVLAHEVMHCALGHPWRRRHRDLETWNHACDYVINDQLINDGFTLPATALSNKTFNGMAAETVYEAIKNNEQDGGGQNKPHPSPNNDNGQNGEGDDQGSGNDSNQPKTPDGRPIPSDESGCGGVIDAPAPDGKDKPTAADYTKQEQEWKTAAAQAAQAAKAAGELSGDLERLVRDQLQPKADWRAILREFITQNAKDDYSWSPPNRRFAYQGIYLPSIKSETVPPIVVAVDTSGSITDKVLAGFESEVNAILEDVNPELIQIIYCDYKVQAIQELVADDLPIKLTSVGGGGTRFNPVFDWVEHIGEIEPACLVYLTDMWNSDKPEDPGYPVLWADYCGTNPTPPEFGETIFIGDS